MKIRGFKDTIAWYDKNAAAYAKTALEHAAYDQIEEFLANLPKGGNILDAGCGSGRDTNIFIREGYNAIGIDLSEGLIKEAKKFYPNIKFVKGNFLDLPFSGQYFDGVWAHASLLHLETINDVKKALSEFRKVLKEKGTLHVLVKAQTGSQKTAVVSDAYSKHDRFFQYFTKEEVRTLLKEAGFEILKIDQYKELERDPRGRPEVEFILALAKK